MSYYLKLYHGRKDPAEQMDDWGEDGPYIGPFSAVTWTYNDLKLHTPDDFEHLSNKINDDMIHHNGVWYGDFELKWIDGLEEANEMKDAISFDDFFAEYITKTRNVFIEKEGA